MYNLIQKYMTENNCYKTNIRIKPKGIMVHSTATPGVMAESWFKIWNKPNINACVHAFLDDKNVCQHLPWDMRGWHSGTGTSGQSANNTHIAFEICEPLDTVFINRSPLVYGLYCTSYAVRAVQTQLKTLNLYNGDITGKYDVATSDAVRKYNDLKGLGPSAVVDRKTWIKLAAEPNSVCMYRASANKDYFNKVYYNAVDLCAMLCRLYDLEPSSILCHSEGYKAGIATNHGDVMHWFPYHGKDMSTFRLEVKKVLAIPEKVNPSTPTKPVCPPNCPCICHK